MSNRKLVVAIIGGLLLDAVLGVSIVAFDVDVYTYISEGPATQEDFSDEGVGCIDDCLDAELSTDLATPSVPEEGI